tara:strand:- start:11655 stop:11960 length:306 start_codon:yes stop_codon:yes gene_type:complete
MNTICPKCGLTKELCVCETIAKEEQRIRIRLVKRRFGKMATVIEGLDTGDINLKEITKQLKSKLACGGTCKEGVIELQGVHTEKLKKELEKLGFNPEMIST